MGNKYGMSGVLLIEVVRVSTSRNDECEESS